MRIIALNGMLYPLRKWLPSKVETPYRWTWREQDADALSATIQEPTALVGFSVGATAAARIALTNPWIKIAYLHSPGNYKGPFIESQCVFRIFRTEGDTTPTFDSSQQLHSSLKQQKDFTSSPLVTLPYVPFKSPTLWERWALARRHHIFHNILPYLPIRKK